MTAPELLARRFHNLYEHMAPQFGYTTREDTRLFIPESTNGKLMIAVCEALASSPEVAAMIAEARREGWNAAKEAAAKHVVELTHSIRLGCFLSADKETDLVLHPIGQCAAAIRALKEETP